MKNVVEFWKDFFGSLNALVNDKEEKNVFTCRFEFVK